MDGRAPAATRSCRGYAFLFVHERSYQAKDLLSVQVLFVHGMGRTPLSGRRLLRILARNGMTTVTFGYMVSLEPFDVIRRRLQARIEALADRGEYVLVGHSLGGILLRASLQAAPPSRLPLRLFLLGSPFRPSRIARRLGRNSVYRLMTRDCGQLLGSASRMEKIGPAPVPVTNIVGTHPLGLTRSWFDGEPNDGIVAVDEATHEAITDCVYLDVLHTWLPASRQVANVVLQRMAGTGCSR